MSITIALLVKVESACLRPLLRPQLTLTSPSSNDNNFIAACCVLFSFSLFYNLNLFITTALILLVYTTKTRTRLFIVGTFASLTKTIENTFHCAHRCPRLNISAEFSWHARHRTAARSRVPIEEDSYIDPVTKLQVFTAYALSKNGSCCGLGCRHVHTRNTCARAADGRQQALEEEKISYIHVGVIRGNLHCLMATAYINHRRSSKSWER